jgi:hypothetical protein
MGIDYRVDLRSDFAIELDNWNEETMIPGYCVDAAILQVI